MIYPRNKVEFTILDLFSQGEGFCIGVCSRNEEGLAFGFCSRNVEISRHTWTLLSVLINTCKEREIRENGGFPESYVPRVGSCSKWGTNQPKKTLSGGAVKDTWRV